jgi:hypothetical protein
MVTDYMITLLEETKAPMKTVRVPLSLFQAVNPETNLSRIEEVRIVFGLTPKGAVAVDDLEFTM